MEWGCKTLEEKIAELNNKSIKAETDILAHLRAFERKRIEDHSNTISRLKMLTKSSNELMLSCEKRSNFKRWTFQFLFWFFLLPAAAISFFGAIYHKNETSILREKYSEQINQEQKIKTQEKQIEWYDEYVINSMNKNPKTHNIFIKKNPFPKH